ncbi:hypothetical protein BC937DRAFT_86458 [Endogone sp. FLAS-F59071]|nr:hypothetical protein BC937DRAFT_86458 [Endogone sp. FLAS-F59071]|eukprot:RUS13032.1 hypothetical protein BC937DRAFT_86458 [Endogone sp. FLAS-F59071]
MLFQSPGKRNILHSEINTIDIIRHNVKNQAGNIGEIGGALALFEARVVVRVQLCGDRNQFGVAKSCPKLVKEGDKVVRILGTDAIADHADVRGRVLPINVGTVEVILMHKADDGLDKRRSSVVAAHDIAKRLTSGPSSDGDADRYLFAVRCTHHRVKVFRSDTGELGGRVDLGEGIDDMIELAPGYFGDC